MSEEKIYMYRVSRGMSGEPITKHEVTKETEKMIFYKNNNGNPRLESKSCDWQIWRNTLEEAIDIVEKKIIRMQLRIDQERKSLKDSIDKLISEDESDE